MPTPTEQIKDRLDIADFIKQYIDLKPAGSNFKANCPFHNEKTASFMVSPAKQIFKCFGCGKGGDIFTFLEEYEGIDFKEAIRILADKAGVQLPRFNAKKESQKNKLYDILQLAAKFYHLSLLKSTSGAPAREYLKKRQIDDLAQDNFMLGWSPDEWRILYHFLKKKGYSESDMIDAGLIKQTSNPSRGGENYYDVFRGRLMFPIFDQYSRVVGFGGRILKDVKDRPKYINTPQTEAYDKSRVLYGLDKAKDSIRGGHKVVIVEGYMDVIASHQAGVKNVVSVSGTALTDGHFQLVKRFTNNVALAFDMDAAGTAAAIRTYQLAGNHQVNIKVVQLPEGKDPDDLIRLSPKKWQQAISNSRHIIDYCFEVVWKDLDISKLDDKKKVRDDILPLIMSITDSVEKNHFLEKLAVLLKVSIEELIREGQRYSQGQTSQRPGINTDQRQPESKKFAQDKGNELDLVRHILALILSYPNRVPRKLKLPVVTIHDDNWARLYKDVQDKYNSRNITSNSIEEFRTKYPDLVAEIALLFSKDYSELDPVYLEREFLRLLNYLEDYIIREKRKALIQQIRSAELAGQEDKVLKLTRKLDQLS